MTTARWAGALAAGIVLTAFVAAAGRAQDEPAKATYVGDKTCMKCHFQEHKSWKKTKLYKAMKSLEPTTEEDKELFDKKKAAGLDPAKDYTADAKCLKCHTTGYGTETGFPADPKTDEKRAKAFGAVACEACHGPGSNYVKHKTETLEKDKEAKFTFESLAPLGLVKPDEALCKTCHNDESPFKEEFKFEEQAPKTHDKKKNE